MQGKGLQVWRVNLLSFFCWGSGQGVHEVRFETCFGPVEGSGWHGVGADTYNEGGKFCQKPSVGRIDIASHMEAGHELGRQLGLTPCMQDPRFLTPHPPLIFSWNKGGQDSERITGPYGQLQRAHRLIGLISS